ncbi:uncharacterized protein LOC142523116 [Primulina tabacum]|uniref:uncharacterized protein LOC142523116 n=1 Tax=Primulina tabacum TaxID=48773 RepID=UPI003F5A68CA
MSSRNPLSVILDQNKLTGPNYHDWLRNLKIFLNSEKIAYVLTKSPPKTAKPNATMEELAELDKWWDHDLQAKSYMLASMSNELQRRFEEAVNAADIYGHLQELYGEQKRPLRHATVKELMTSRLREGASVHEHGVRMIGLIEKLVCLDLVFPNELSTDILLLSLPLSFDGFVVNFNMNKLEASLEELVNMLTSYEATIKKEKPVFLIGSSSGTKKGPKGKSKKRSRPSKKNKPNKKRVANTSKGPEKPEKEEDVCFHCKKSGH